MDVTLIGTKVTQNINTFAFEKNNGVDVINVTVDTDASWSYKLDVQYTQKLCSGERLYNVIDLTRDGNVCSATLTAGMLPFSGKYILQLRGINADGRVYHSEQFNGWVKYSIDPGAAYDPVPSEFYQIEANITSMNNHPPKPGDNGYWLIWNVTKQEYEESDIPLPEGELPDIDETTKGKYLTNDGTEASWADVEALPEMSAATKGQYLTNDGETAEWADVDALPAMSSDTAGKMLTNDGENAEWGGAVRYDVSQNIDYDNKLQARQNIGAFPGKVLPYFFDTTTGSAHDNDITAARTYDIINPGNKWSIGSTNNNGMDFPLYVLSLEEASYKTYRVKAIDIKGVAWEIIYNTASTAGPSIYNVSRTFNDTMCVHFFEQDDSGNLLADKNWDDAAALIEAGGWVFAVDDNNGGVIYPLSWYNPRTDSDVGTIEFYIAWTNVGIAGAYVIQWTSDGSVKFIENILNDLPYVSFVNDQNLKADDQAIARKNIGLDQVDNTSDANKPVSTAQEAAIKVVQDALDQYKTDVANGTAIPARATGDASGNNIANTYATKQELANLPTTSVTASSTDAEIPTAKAVYDAIPHPETKSDAQTQPVGMDADGKLWTQPGGGSSGAETWQTATFTIPKEDPVSAAAFDLPSENIIKAFLKISLFGTLESKLFGTLVYFGNTSGVYGLLAEPANFFTATQDIRTAWVSLLRQDDKWQSVYTPNAATAERTTTAAIRYTDLTGGYLYIKTSVADETFYGTITLKYVEG